jgi:predicted AlkP superfamily pyrophosphatase or phosphodiesterase
MKRKAVALASTTTLLMVLLICSKVICDEGNPKSDSSGKLNTILISWDGLDRSVLWELLAKQKLPNLAQIIKEGSLQEIDVKGHVTVTKPSHAEMLTALGVKDTGVVSNGEYRPIPQGYSIFERIQEKLGGKDKVRTFMVTGKVAHVGGRGPEEAARWELERRNLHLRLRGRKLPEGADNVPEAEQKSKNQGEPFYLTRRALDMFDAAQRDASETGPLCLQYLDQFKSPRFVGFLHFSDTDHAGHHYGIDSEQYRDAAIECDEWLGKIVEWLKRESIYAQTIIYVTTDHGFDPHGHGHKDAPHSWLATNDRSVTHGGTIADVPATIMAHYGVDIEQLVPKPIGRPLTGIVQNVVANSKSSKKSTPHVYRSLDGLIRSAWKGLAKLLLRQG